MPGVSMSWMMVVIIAVSVVFAILVAAVITLLVLRAKSGKQKEEDKAEVKIVDGERYSADDSNASVTRKVGDITLKRGQTYVAKKDTDLLPGKYTVYAVSENVGSFNIRIGGLVREYKHNSNLVLAENEQITPVSHSVILR